MFGAFSFAETGFATGSITSAAGVIPSAIPSAEAFGSVVLSSGAVVLAPVSIASTEAFGSPVLSLGDSTIVTTSIPSGEVFGTATVIKGVVTLTPGAIASPEQFGSPSLTVGVVTISASGIASLESFGTAELTYPVSITVTGIASAEGFGRARARAFTASHRPRNPIGSHSWVGYDESNDDVALTATDPTQAGSWVADGSTLVVVVPDTTSTTGSWVAN